MKSKLCQDKAMHGWCANRNTGETHCTCLCHKLKAQASAIRGLSDAYQRVLPILQAELNSLEKRLERFK